ncbi:simple sugar transport system permease protein [Paenibacillus shirakamiensis]|uniref:Simple sugar transport system permease protein n=1 Tax=Paenibacillus shirakamiensis TaxID=1265935 RepID=A0ABS4JIS6_9BACL|nr:ABC transporter permease [Paenibacillus shirakamiensis]MBP2001605.1 simple sugar transport system permease protein [Paenibacillus shirakamiensis]
MDTVKTLRTVKPIHPLTSYLFRYGAVLIILGVIAFFSITNDHFLTYSNLKDILKAISITTFLALGVTFSLVVDGFDISVGSTTSLATIAAASALVLHRQELLITLLVPLLCGIGVGLFNAFLVVKVKLPDLLATLAVMYIVNGIQMTYTKGYSIYEGMAGTGGEATGKFIPSFLFIGQGEVLGIPVAVLLMLLFVGLAYIFLEKTTFGRHMYMVGGNAEAANLFGIPVNRYRVLAYVISGLFAALGGIVLASRIGTGQVSAGAPLLMDAVASAYIGFALFGEKRPSVVGTLLGSILIGVLLNGLTMMNVPYFAQDIIKGSILVLALTFSFLRKERSA